MKVGISKWLFVGNGYVAKIDYGIFCLDLMATQAVLLSTE